MRFIAKGHKVNAVLFDGTNLDEVKKLVSPRGVHSQEGEFFVVLHEGNLQFLAGEYIVGNGYGHINVRAKEGFERDFVPIGGYEVEKVYCVYDREKVGKQDCLPHEGIYLTEDEAVKACISPRYFIVPVQVGMPMPAEAHESEYNWYPRLQTKEDAIRIRNEYAARVQREREERDKPENLIKEMLASFNDNPDSITLFFVVTNFSEPSKFTDYNYAKLGQYSINEPIKRDNEIIGYIAHSIGFMGDGRAFYIITTKKDVNELIQLNLFKTGTFYAHYNGGRMSMEINTGNVNMFMKKP